MSNPLFSILVANYNNARYIKECIDSILNQNYRNIEIIIVDDASVDNSVEVIKDIQAKYDNIYLYINDKNRGAGYTKNICIAKMNGQLGGFVDPDDALDKTAVEIMVDAHIKNPESSLIYSTNYKCDENLNIITKTKFVKQQPDNILVAQQTFIDHFVSFKKSLYDKTGGTDPFAKRAVDRDLYCLLETVGSVKFIDLPLYYYRVHSGGISKTSNVYKAEYWDWVVKHRYLREKGLSNEELYNDTILRYRKSPSDVPTNQLIKELLRRLRSQILFRKNR